MSDDTDKRAVPNLGSVRPGATMGDGRQAWPRNAPNTRQPAPAGPRQEPAFNGTEMEAAAGWQQPQEAQPALPPREYRTAPPELPHPAHDDWRQAALQTPPHLPPPGPPQSTLRPLAGPMPPPGYAMQPPLAGQPRTGPPRPPHPPAGQLPRPLLPAGGLRTQPPSGPSRPSQSQPDPAAEAFRGPRSIYGRSGDETQRPRRSLLGRVVRYGLLGLLLLVLGGVGLLLVAPPTDLIRDKVIAEVKAKTGRDLTVGSARLTILPSLGVNLKNVSLSGPAGMPGAPLLTARGIEVSVALLPLITREVQIDRLVLVEPVVNLRIDRSGRRNWDFAGLEELRQPHPVRYAQAAPPRGQEFRKLPPDLQDFAKNTTTPPKPRGLGLSALSLGDVRISEGHLRYRDERAGLEREVSGINARITLKDLGGPLNLRGDLVYMREKLNVDASIYALRDFLEDRPTRLTLRLAGTPLTASYDGEIARGGGAIEGRLSVKTQSVAGLARLAELPLPGLDALGALGIEGEIKTGPGSYSITNGTFSLGDFKATGNLAVNLAAGRPPQIKTALKIAHLDIDRLTSFDASAPTAPAVVPRAEPAPAPTPATPRAPERPAEKSIEDLIKESDSPPRPGTAVRGFTKREGWSQDPLPFGLLQLVDVDGRVQIGRITWQQLKVGQTQLAIDLKGGVLKTQIQEIELYGGRGRGLISLDARQPDGVLGLNLSADALTLGPLLRDAAAIDMIEGRGRLLIAVNGKGSSEREIIGTLAGKAEIFLNDGTIVGWDANALLAEMGQLKLPKFDRNPALRTAYKQLSMSYQIANGVGRTSDILFDSQQVKASGTGVVNLVDRNLNLLVKPKVASGPLANIEVPLRIAGNFDAINAVPELKGSSQLKQLGQRVRDQDIDNAARSLLGDTPEAEKGAAKAKELLRRFIRP